MDTVTWLKAKIEELRAFYSEASGKLAAAAGIVAAVLSFISTDPSAALLLAQILPGPLRWIAIVAVALIAYVLPAIVKKRDDEKPGS